MTELGGGSNPLLIFTWRFWFWQPNPTVGDFSGVKRFVTFEEHIRFVCLTDWAAKVVRLQRIIEGLVGVGTVEGSQELHP